MKNISYIFLILVSLSANGKSLSNDEVINLHKDIENMYTAFENGDVSLLLAKTHHSIYSLVGGKESFKDLMEVAAAQFMATGMNFLSSVLKEPTNLYIAGEEEVCFVPRISIMELKGNKMKSTGFMIAIRKIGSSRWAYLDGSGLRKNQGLLWQLFPKLERDIRLPANYITQLQ